MQFITHIITLQNGLLSGSDIVVPFGNHRAPEHQGEDADNHFDNSNNNGYHIQSSYDLVIFQTATPIKL